MIPQITSALSRGFSSKQIIDFILKKFPEHSDKIKSVLAGGFTAEQVLRFLSGNKDQTQTQLHKQPTTEFQQTRQRDIERREEIDKNALKAGALAATSLAAPMAASALKRALPTALESTIPSLIGQSQPQMIPQQSLEQPPVNQVAASIPEPSNIMQQKEISNPKEYLEKKGVLNEVIDSLKKGNNPLQVATQLGIKKTGHAKIDPELLKNIEEFSALPQEETETNLIPKPTEMVEKPIEKSSLVASPQGIGEVKSIKDKSALVDINGKLTKVDIKDLETEPPDIAELYDNLFNAIPDEYKSRMMNYAGYDEDANELIFRPHGGSAYVYKDIPPEFAEDLKNRLHRAKTTGKNMYGMWNEGDQSFGAGMSALIRGLQKVYGGKGKEYVRKYNTLFDILGIPHEEKKRKEQEERFKRKRNG